MKNTIKQIFHSGKFVTGFVIFLAILLTIIIYPFVVAKDPLAMIGNGNFFKPGTYLSIQDTVNSGKTYKMNVDATASIVESKLTMDNRSMMAEWLEKYGGVDASEIDVTDAEGLIALWEEKYDPNAEQKGLIAAKKKKYQRLDNEIDGILEDVPTIIAEKNEETGELEEVQSIDSKQYINEKDVINRQTFVLGTDNFGRDVLTELISATGSSLKIGLVAGIIATDVIARVILALVVCIVLCTFFTTIAGFFTAKFKMHPFISTMANMLVIFGIVTYATKGVSFGAIEATIPNMVIPKVNGFPTIILWAVAAIAIVWFIWNKTTFGKNLYAVGGNPEAASVSGISVFGVTVGAFVMAGVLYGFGSWLECIRMVGSGSAAYGQGWEMDAIAACVVGGVSFTGGIGKISGVVVGVFIFTALTYSLTILGIDTNLQFVFSGIIILVAVTLDCLKYVQKK